MVLVVTAGFLLYCMSQVGICTYLTCEGHCEHFCTAETYIHSTVAYSIQHITRDQTTYCTVRAPITQRLFSWHSSLDLSCLLSYLSPGAQDLVLPPPAAREAEARLVLDNDDAIIQAFLTKWTKRPERKPQPADIKGVFRIDNPALKRKFDQYCATLLSSKVELHYHGTAMKCNLLQSQTFCSDTTCGVCGISRDGFDKTRIGTHVDWFKRFGHAFYLAPNSSKCHEYTLGFGNLRALLYCQVALGNPYYTRSDLEKCQSPPEGCHSVYGEAGRHHSRKGSLNYDEVAVYVSEAILPRYIVVYQKDGIGGLL